MAVIIDGQEDYHIVTRKLSSFHSCGKLSRKKKVINTSYYLTLAGRAPMQSNFRTPPRDSIVRTTSCGQVKYSQYSTKSSICEE